MYIKGSIDPVIDKVHTGYMCTIKTPGVIVSKYSSRSRMEALTESLKFIGLPM